MAKKKAKKTVAKKTVAKKTAPREVLVVGSKVKAYIKSKGGKTSADVLGALNDQVHSLIDAAVVRSQANKRTTLRAADL